jgi:hypothetical protein
MKTIHAVVAVEPGGKISLQTPLVSELSPGEHAAVLIVEETATSSAQSALRLPVYDVDLKKDDCTFRREEIYGDDGR